MSPLTSIAALAPVLALTVLATPAHAQSSAAPAESTMKIVPTGYVEAFYAYNFSRPSNGITNYREFDNRHDTFNISNAALGASWTEGPVSARLVMQVGTTPSTYYIAEPLLAGTNVVNTSGPEVWKFIQEANLGYKVPFGQGVLLEAGVFLSPIGPEVIAVKDNWNWSRSNVFAGLPTYITGARATYSFDDAWSMSLGVYNGWNNVVDNNTEKSVSTNVDYHVGKLSAQLLYFGGVEWPNGSPQGHAWRSDFDGYVRWLPLDWLSLLANINTGFDPNDFGTSAWYAGALYARVQPLSWLHIALRGDRFYEHLGSGANGAAPPIFWAGAQWVSEATATIDLQPVDRFIVLVEYRHDQAEKPLYFRGNVLGAGTPTNPFLPNTHWQDTVTLGATTWF